MNIHQKVNIEVAQKYFEDCQDFMLRYDSTIVSFGPIKSRRLKCFADLRAAYECALKCAIAYLHPAGIERHTLISTIERYSHKISSLEEAITQFQGVYIKEFEPWGNLLNTLPVSLRYSLDGSDFLDAKEELYYQTIGSDEWLLAFRTYLTKVVASLDEKLKEHSGIVSMSDIDLDEILRSEHNKYRQN